MTLPASASTPRQSVSEAFKISQQKQSQLESLQHDATGHMPYALHRKVAQCTKVTRQTYARVTSNLHAKSQSCLNHVTHCCGGASSDCQCNDIQAACNFGNGESCAVFASTCCNDDECKCHYKTKSCSASVESALEGASLSQDCLDAEQLCCADCTPDEKLQASILVLLVKAMRQPPHLNHSQRCPHA